MIRKYHNHSRQTNPCHFEEESHNNHETPERLTKESNQLSHCHQDDCKTRMDTKNAQQFIEQLQNPTMGKQSTTNQQQSRVLMFWHCSKCKNTQYVTIINKCLFNVAPNKYGKLVCVYDTSPQLLAPKPGNF